VRSTSEVDHASLHTRSLSIFTLAPHALHMALTCTDQHDSMFFFALEERFASESSAPEWSAPAALKLSGSGHEKSIGSKAGTLADKGSNAADDSLSVSSDITNEKSSEKAA
jgi:hypothetical protein